MSEPSPIVIVRHASTWSIVWGALLIIFGIRLRAWVTHKRNGTVAALSCLFRTLKIQLPRKGTVFGVSY
jgi:hypothetical protein